METVQERQLRMKSQVWIAKERRGAVELRKQVMVWDRGKVDGAERVKQDQSCLVVFIQGLAWTSDSPVMACICVAWKH